MPGAAATRPANAGTSMPAPMQAPCSCTCIPVGEKVGQASRAAGQAGHVGGGRVGEGPELGEITTAAERRTIPAARCTAVMLVVGGRQRGAPPTARVAQCGGDRVVPVRPIERDVQDVANTFGQHRRGRVGRQWPGSPKGRAAQHGELGAGLQGRVHGRLCRQPLLDRAHLAGPQQHRPAPLRRPDGGDRPARRAGRASGHADAEQPRRTVPGRPRRPARHRPRRPRAPPPAPSRATSRGAPHRHWRRPASSGPSPDAGGDVAVHGGEELTEVGRVAGRGTPGDHVSIRATRPRGAAMDSVLSTRRSSLSVSLYGRSVPEVDVRGTRVERKRTRTARGARRRSTSPTRTTDER